MEEFLTTGEIARILKINILTVRRWIHAGLLPATKFFKEYRISKKDFDMFLEKRRVKK